MITEVIFDVETQKLFEDLDSFDPAGLGISVVSAYIRTIDQNFNEIKGSMHTLTEPELNVLWPHFQNADRIIGFNSLRFDVPVLQPYTSLPLNKFNHFDIMDHVKRALGKRLSLNSIARETLGTIKTDVGTNAVLYWQKGDPESLQKLRAYCEADVTITKQIYDYALKNKSLKYLDKWNTVRSIAVDFSYPENETAIMQESLF